jgi:UDP-N-acetylmuramate--alanine ligase
VREFVQQIHFVGIGGAGMSGIASVMLNQGYRVTGSDMVESDVTVRLRETGVKVTIGHSADSVAQADVVVTSTAVGTNNIEVQAAVDAGIPVIPRAEMLGELMRFRQGIAVAGTHGKTTTTSLIAAVLAAANLDPTFLVGGLVKSVSGNARLGSGPWLIAEADESDASFLYLQPYLAVVTNIDSDHMDFYGGNFDRLVSTFADFLSHLPFYGLAILCADDPVVVGLRTRLKKPVVTYGSKPGADYYASDIRPQGSHMMFHAHLPDGTELPIDLALAGRHNVLNALAAIAVADKVGASHESIVDGLKNFQGIDRRFEILGELIVAGGSAVVVDDYAHHPSEIAATLEAVSGCWPVRRRVVVFQPHRYTRTRDLLDEFAALLATEPHLVVTDVYPAGEAVIASASGAVLCERIRALGGVDPVYLEDVFLLPDKLLELAQPGDVVLTLGAGNIGRVARGLVGEQSQGTEGGIE